MKSISILVHLNSGGNSGRTILANLQSLCAKRNIDYKIYVSKYPNHMIELAEEVAVKNKDIENHRIVVLGGDGTLNEVVSSLVIKGIFEPLAYFPAGTGNDFARGQNITHDIEYFIDNLFSVEATKIKILSANSKIDNKNIVAVNSIGIGFDALVSYLNTKERNTVAKVGRLAYLSKILDAFKQRNTYSVKISIDDKEHKFSNVLLSTFMKNGYFGGGIKLDPFITRDSEEISLIIAKEVEGKDVLKILPHILFSGKQFEKTNKLERIVGKKFNVLVEEKQYLQSDGEVDVYEKIDLDIKLIEYPFYLIGK